MKNILKKVLLTNKISREVTLFIYETIKEFNLYLKTKKTLKYAKSRKNKVFYLGIPAQTNLGDLAQGVCIRRWLKKHYPEKIIIEVETNALVNTHFSLLKKLQESYYSGDMIVFQSGYTTTDLGGHADEMHRTVMKVLPHANILMMPQTIYFKSKQNQDRTAKVYNQMKNMLFLARDEISYHMANKMFPDIKIDLYPDIVTTLIGTKKFKNERNGILFCCRDDGEKFYSDDQIEILMHKCKLLGPVIKTDTTKYGKTRDIVKNAQNYIYQEIKNYSRYKVIITDRYHGTILSLVAGTPVIVLKTNDHKVITGAKWFKGVYDEYVYLVNDLNEAFTIASKVYYKHLSNQLDPYFEKEYYDKLPKLFENLMRGDN